MHCNFKDITNERFGKLVAVRYYEKDNASKYYWECICDCGKIHHTSGHALRQGRTKSCGCETGRNKKQDREGVVIKNLYTHTIKKRSRKLGFDTYIDYDYFKEIIFKPCFYCGIEHSKVVEDIRYEKGVKIPITDTVFYCNGIDRIDSDIGYIEDNVKPCCTLCNRAKHTMKVDEFISWVKKLYSINIEKRETF